MSLITTDLSSVIHKSLRDFRPLWYSSRDHHAEGEHVNRGRGTPKFLPYLTGPRYVQTWWRGRRQILANSKTKTTFLFPVYAVFRHDCPLAVKPAITPWHLVDKQKLGKILYLLLCSFLLWLSWLLRSRVRNFREDLWITLYLTTALFLSYENRKVYCGAFW
jgi:hypothetical protein